MKRMNASPGQVKALWGAGAIPLWFTLMFSGTAHAVNTTFNADITSAGTCTLSFTPASPLALQDTTAAALIDNTAGAVTGIKPMTLTFTGCPLLAPTMIPTLTVSGETIEDATDEDDQPFLFKSAGASTSEGFGIVLANKAAPTFADADLIKKDQALALGVAGDVVTNNTQKSFWWGLSCGKAASCDGQRLQPGSLSASVTFTFDYK